jgi:purine nucleoside permease
MVISSNPILLRERKQDKTRTTPLTTPTNTDNAHLEVFLRGTLASLVDYARVAIMRTASDFDRAPPSETEVFHLLYADQQGFEPSIENIFIVGNAIVEDVLKNWSGVYAKGIVAGNYLGDLFDSLGGKIKPDIG